MTTIREIKAHFEIDGLRVIENDCADYMFVKRPDGEMFQYSNEEYKFYRTMDGFAKACLWRVKRG